MLYDVAALLINMLGVLVSYSVTVKELKLLFSLLKAQGRKRVGHRVSVSVRVLQDPKLK